MDVATLWRCIYYWRWAQYAGRAVTLLCYQRSASCSIPCVFTLNDEHPAAHIFNFLSASAIVVVVFAIVGVTRTLQRRCHVVLPHIYFTLGKFTEGNGNPQIMLNEIRLGAIYTETGAWYGAYIGIHSFTQKLALAFIYPAGENQGKLEVFTFLFIKTYTNTCVK